ncbi:HepT-like ribonuclease domain-containing protein [uncultured Desulfobacter sp.]|uniref:HepT-like ribonuclease domain-containing protein n=1 Tax=uncultured Desulfobacter sp. TaxID=240139 RepID=UPI0029F4F10B|nr:HepT-like ribonuclease domain-containing protein [uncultured Desulfobacter sp.]
MFDKDLVDEILSQVLTAAHRIERRSKDIFEPDDFLISDAGIDKLDAICMMLIAIGENLKNLDKVTDGKLLVRFPEVDWKGAKGMRDIISHHYFDLNAEVVFSICKDRIPGLVETTMKIKKSL